MIEASDCEVAKWRQDPSEKCSPGDACCAGGDLSPEQKLFNLLPKLNEVLFEILDEEPFHRATMLVTQGGSISIKQQTIIESITSFSQKVLHNQHFKKSPRRTVEVKAEVRGLKVGETTRVGDLLTFDVQVSKIPGLKSSDQRLWLVLVNQTSREVQIVEFKQNYDKIDQQFTKLLDVGGTQTFHLMVVGGDGEMTLSAAKVFNVSG